MNIFFELVIIQIYIRVHIHIYIYTHTHFSLPNGSTQTQLTLFLSAAKVVKPASSQYLLWVAGRSSLTSLARPAWLGYFRPSDMHPFGYTPNALVPKALK